MVPEGLALVDVGDMHLDDREFAGVQGVEDGDRRVREGGGIDDDAAGPLARLMNPVDDLEFGIALVKFDFEIEFSPSSIPSFLRMRGLHSDA